jgi:hypothetical protein
MYERILRIIDAPEFHGKNWKLLEPQNAGDGTSSDLIAHAWRSDTGMKLVIVNLGPGTATARIYFSDDLLPGKVLLFHDLLSSVTYEKQAMDLKQSGLLVKEDGFAARIFDVQPV